MARIAVLLVVIGVFAVQGAAVAQHPQQPRVEDFGAGAPALLVPAVVAPIEGLSVRRSLPVLLMVAAGVLALLAVVTPSFSLALVLALIALDGVGGAGRSHAQASLTCVSEVRCAGS